VALITGLLLVPVPAEASSSSDFVSRINAERTARGTSALTVRADLTAAAQAQANRMATRAEMFHNPNLGGSVSHWTMLAENVGYGPDVARVHAAFMASASHRANILNGKYTEVGVGVVVKDHVMWVAEVFRRPAGATKASSGHHSSSSAENKHVSKPAAAHAATHKAASKATKRTSSAPKRASVASLRPPAAPSARGLALATLAASSIPGAVASSPRPVQSDQPPDTTVPTAFFVGLSLLSLVVVGNALRIRV
jgi:hypothetical protein